MNLFTLLSNAAWRHGQRAAVFHGYSEVLTYDALRGRSLALATGLRHRLTRGAAAAPSSPAGNRIAIVTANCPEYLEILFGAWAAGMAVVPVNAKLHPAEIMAIVDDADAKLVLTSAELAATLARLPAREPPVPEILIIGASEYLQLLEHPPTVVANVQPDELAWLFYTSGTTGRSKGAMLTHRNLTAMTLAHLADFEDLSPPDRIIHAAPLSHGSGLYVLPYVARAAGHVIPASGGFDAAEFLEICGVHRGCGAFLAPTMVQRVRLAAECSGQTPPGLRSIIYGGGPMYLDEIKRSLECLGPVFQQLYGQGEAPMTITGLRRVDFADRSDAVLSSVGWPRSGVEVAVVDAEDRPSSIGEVGEIVCRGEVVMKGYWRNPDATRATLRGGWLHTGDMGCFDQDGKLTLRDRSKDVIISGGSNIYPREVEEVLAAHPQVAEVSVLGERDPEWGENVVAFIVARHGARVSEAELERCCLERIARFKRPKRYVFLQELPKNSNGKVLKRELAKLLAADQTPCD